MTALAFIIKSTEALRNENNDIVVKHEQFKKPPEIILTPYWQGSRGNVGYIPTVLDVTATRTIIRDKNYAPNYYLNVLCLPHEARNVHDLAAFAYTKQKNTHDKDWVYAGEHKRMYVTLLTPYSKSGDVRSVETVTWLDPPTGPGQANAHFISRNRGKDYFVTGLSVDMGQSPNAEAGWQSKAQKTMRFYFLKPWEVTPVVFVTPFVLKQNEPVKFIDTVTNVTKTYFEVTSDNIANNLLINWVAVTPDIPIINSLHLETAFAHYNRHFPEHKSKIQRHKTELIKIIREGGTASAALQKEPFVNQPRHTRKRGDHSEEAKAIAKVCFDCAAIILGLLGVVVTARAQYLETIAEDILEAAPAERDALLIGVKELANAKAASAKVMAGHVLKIARLMYAADVLKSLIVRATEDLPGYVKVVTVISILAQLAFIIAASLLTDGAGAIAVYGLWILRIAALVGSGTTLAFDAIKLRDILAKG